MPRRSSPVSKQLFDSACKKRNIILYSLFELPACVLPPPPLLLLQQQTPPVTLPFVADAIIHALLHAVRERGNLLLTTLLLGNTIVNASISILISGATSGLAGLFISTGLIVIFGEIVPQSVCTRHGLRIGAIMVPIVQAFQ